MSLRSTLFARRANAWLAADLAPDDGRGTADRPEPAWSEPVACIHQPPMVRGVRESADASVRGRTVHQVTLGDDPAGEAIRPAIRAEAIVRLYHDDPATAGARWIVLSALAPPAFNGFSRTWQFEGEHRA